MQLRPTAEPLDGSWICSLKVRDTAGNHILAKRQYAFEAHFRERIRVTRPPEHPGVVVYDTYDASSPVQAEPITLEEAIAANEHYQRYLLSIGGEGLIILTSRVRYDWETEAEVLPARHGVSLPVDFLDVEGSLSDEQLMEKHLGRVMLLGGNTLVDLPQEFADAAFAHVVDRAPERP